MFEQHLDQHARILELIKSGHFKQIQIVSIDVSQIGIPGNLSNGLVEMEGNALVLLPSYFNFNERKEFVSNNARVAVVFNRRENPGLIFSNSGFSTGFAAYQDLGAAVLSFQRFYVYVLAAGVDGSGHPLHFAVLKGVNLATGQANNQVQVPFGFVSGGSAGGSYST